MQLDNRALVALALASTLATAGCLGLLSGTTSVEASPAVVDAASKQLEELFYVRPKVLEVEGLTAAASVAPLVREDPRVRERCQPVNGSP